MRRTTITLPDDLAVMVAAEAERLRTSVSEVIRRFVVQGFSSPHGQARDIPFAGLFHDPTMPLAAEMHVALADWTDDQDRDRG